MEFLCGIAITLLLESIVLILETEKLRRKLDDISV